MKPIEPTLKRRLDAVIAEHIMGIKRGYWSNHRQEHVDCDWFDNVVPQYDSCRTEYAAPIDFVPMYSVDISETMKVVDFFVKKYPNARICIDIDNVGVVCTIGQFTNSGNSLAKAICESMIQFAEKGSYV